MREAYVYIMSNKSHRLYIGSTTDLIRRARQHKAGTYPNSFTARYNYDLARRQHGYGRGGRMKIEHDEAEIVGGIRGGETLGSPIAITIKNLDHENWRGAMDPWELDAAETEKRRVHAPRPGHADLVG